jgi:hypothetical protein
MNPNLAETIAALGFFALVCSLYVFFAMLEISWEPMP